ncbi:MAG: glycosyltransferase [Flavobacteriales bacterium]|nr:glycosyltransferase [Flavobacteriales bacterium]MCW8937694.1 glycosyltransferase [Flavobacteriales bacterium]MCW8969483.1 glycosyltransferase [Flavobacteriales bacterium]MCW8990182.1 glycosyltransferase [Flavobacteriales bacterium]MCW9019900.1 glycosyltransferase [Flavobacteriales bacterium]
MIKLGYFTQALFGVSETFVFDLVKALSNDENIDFTYVSKHEKSLQAEFSINNLTVNFSHKYISWLIRWYKINELLGRDGSSAKMNLKKWLALKALTKKVTKKFDVAFIEFADTAILLMDYLDQQKTPFIVHVHGHDITSSLNDKAYSEELMILFKKAAFFIAASEYMKRRLVLLGCDENKIKVIRLGIDSKHIEPIPWSEKIKLSPSIIFLGRLTDKKHPIALLHAFKIVLQEIPEATLSIIGDGKLKNEVVTTINNLSLNESVKLYGALPREKSYSILKSHWIYAQHSVTPINGDTEGFAISLAEAALHELPVVSTIHNGITENVIDGKTGYLVPEYNYEAMADKIIYLIKNPIVAEEMGKAGKEHILNLCNPTTRIKAIKSLIIETNNYNEK